MEHIVQFAIGIDDETIRKRIEGSAYNDICDRFYKEAFAEKLVQSYSRTKAYKETMAEIDKKVISDEK